MTDTPDTEKNPRGRKPKAEANEPIEKQGWKTADKLCKNIDAAGCPHVMLGRVFLYDVRSC